VRLWLRHRQEADSQKLFGLGFAFGFFGSKHWLEKTPDLKPQSEKSALDKPDL
jgi:hypothetical protein